MEENAMSLLSEAMEPSVIVDKRTLPDGMGGTVTAWVDGAQIEAAIVLDNSLQARIAEKDGVTAVYTITTEKNVNLQFHDVLRRTSDSKVFRVTSDGDDKHTPASARLNMRQVSAEEWSLPNG
jgi:folylpolyglutamate synthase/dihydropteroate synthase